MEAFSFEWLNIFKCGQHRRLLEALFLQKSECSHYLARVPADFTVEPFIKPISDTEPINIVLACNYSPIKGFAAILQIIYGSQELFKARGRQLEKYGYASYSLTVVPYILMSLVNFLAAALQPQYPSMFIVLHQADNAADHADNTAGQTGNTAHEENIENKIAGAVGKAYGDLKLLERPGTDVSTMFAFRKLKRC